MLEKLSKYSVSFILEILERPCHILSYSCLFDVLFASLKSLLKKIIVHSHTLKIKISFYLMLEILERLRHILSYSCLFDVLFASLKSLLKKL